METWREGGVVSCDQVLNGVNWKGKVRGISPMGFYMLAFFNFGATGTAHLPSMPSPRCIPSVLRVIDDNIGIGTNLEELTLQEDRVHMAYARVLLPPNDKKCVKATLDSVTVL